MQYTNNDIVLEENTNAVYFFVISSGKCIVIEDGDEKQTLESGDSFGEMALLHNTIRNSTIESDGTCELWTLERKQL